MQELTVEKIEKISGHGLMDFAAYADAAMEFGSGFMEGFNSSYNPGVGQCTVASELK